MLYVLSILVIFNMILHFYIFTSFENVFNYVICFFLLVIGFFYDYNFLRVIPKADRREGAFITFGAFIYG